MVVRRIHVEQVRLHPQAVGAGSARTTISPSRGAMHGPNQPADVERAFTAASSGTLCNEHEAAELLGLSVKTLRRWRWAGCGPIYHKLGTAVRYSHVDLSEYVLAGRRASTSDRGGRP